MARREDWKRARKENRVNRKKKSHAEDIRNRCGIMKGIKRVYGVARQGPMAGEKESRSTEMTKEIVIQYLDLQLVTDSITECGLSHRRINKSKRRCVKLSATMGAR